MPLFSRISPWHGEAALWSGFGRGVDMVQTHLNIITKALRIHKVFPTFFFLPASVLWDLSWFKLLDWEILLALMPSRDLGGEAAGGWLGQKCSHIKQACWQSSLKANSFPCLLGLLELPSSLCIPNEEKDSGNVHRRTVLPSKLATKRTVALSPIWFTYRKGSWCLSSHRIWGRRQQQPNHVLL